MADIIVVGVDGSATADAAAEAAARLARGTGSALHVVTAFEPRPSGEVRVGSDVWHFNPADQALAVAEAVAGRFRSDLPAVTTAAAPGKPQEVLVDEATRVEASIIVVGNRRMQGPGRLLGSIASSVAHHAPCDVYIVKTV